MTRPTIVVVARWLGAYLWPVVGLVAVVVLVTLWRADHQPAAIPASVQKTQDSLAVTGPLDSVVAAQAHQSSVRHERSAETHTAIARYSVSAATALRHTADSLAVVAHASADSTDAWRRTAMAYKAEGDSLRAALTEQTKAVVDLTVALADARRETKVEHDRRVSLEDQNKKLVAAAVRAAQCKVLGPIPCPTRGEAFIVGALTTAVVVLAK